MDGDEISSVAAKEISKNRSSASWVITHFSLGISFPTEGMSVTSLVLQLYSRCLQLEYSIVSFSHGRL